MRGELGGGGLLWSLSEAAGGTGRQKSEEELSYIQPGFHREDGVVLPFKENLREQRSVREEEMLIHVNAG